MLKKPDIRNKEGLKTLSVYGLIMLVVGKYFIPDLEQSDIMAIISWWNSHDMSFDKLYDLAVDGTAGGYILNKLRSGNNANTPA